MADLKKDKTNEELLEKKKVFEAYLKLCEQQTEANKKIREAEAELNQKLIDQYAAITEAEIKVLLVDDKWMATMHTHIQSEMQRISQRLTQRIKELAERYQTPMPILIDEVKAWEKKVATHLTKMGLVWS